VEPVLVASIAHPVLAQTLSATAIGTREIAYIVIGVIVLIILIGLFAFSGRGRRADDVERFRRARDMTTAWSQGRPTPPRRGDANGNPERRRDQAGT
jgi:hypothetical protein